jgi:peptide/nickel transport system substrate-binding protein
MGRGTVSAVGALVGLALTTGSAIAAPFKCPHTGGDFVFGQEANINSLDPMTSATISTRNIAMNMFESLMTHDANFSPILELADSMTESPDHLTYTFKLRQGVHFHNGKLMTSADVVASFNRYARIGRQRSTLDNVDRWDVPGKDTFVIHMKRVQPIFIQALSSFGVPIVMIPAEHENDPSHQLGTIGTGPYELVQSVPGSFIKLKRFDGYLPNPYFDQRTGFGGYKQACFDTVRFRIITDDQARVGGLKTSELQGTEDVPSSALPDVRNNTQITILPLNNWWIQITYPNTSMPPTDNLMFRKAVQAALNMDEIMDAASDGNYRLNVGFQYPGQADDSDAGKDTYNLYDAALAKKYLGESGYKGEPVILLTDKDYAPMCNSALVMQQELQAVGINAELKVTDWPTSVQLSQKADSGWNFFYTGWGTQPVLGALATMRLLVDPGAIYMPKDRKGDPDVRAAWNDMNNLPTPEGRQQAFARMQKIVLDKVYAIPFGSFTQVQAVRSDVKGFVPFRIPRMADVWFEK